MKSSFFDAFRKDKSKTSANNVEIKFQEADSNLDIFTQARINIQNFYSYFQQSQIDASIHYSIVSKTLSKAYGILTNRCAELEINRETYEKQIASIQEDTNRFNKEVEINKELLNQLLNREKFLICEKSRLSQELLRETQQRNKIAETKKKILRIKYDMKSIEDKASTMEQHYHVLHEQLLNLEREYREAVENSFDCGNELENTARKSEILIKELVSRIKSIESEQEKNKPKPSSNTSKTPLPSPEKSSYLIVDTVKYSDRDIINLKNTIQIIEDENSILSAELDSKKMDTDCLMQQNIGLKQIIRDLVEK